MCSVTVGYTRRPGSAGREERCVGKRDRPSRQPTDEKLEVAAEVKANEGDSGAFQTVFRRRISRLPCRTAFLAEFRLAIAALVKDYSVQCVRGGHGHGYAGTLLHCLESLVPCEFRQFLRPSPDSRLTVQHPGRRSYRMADHGFDSAHVRQSSLDAVQQSLVPFPSLCLYSYI